MLRKTIRCKDQLRPLSFSTFAIFYFGLVFNSLTATAQQLPQNFPFTNGQVNCMERVNDTLYLGGNFTRLYRPDSIAANGTLLHSFTGNAFAGSDKPNGPVHSTISDGANGFFIGGDFTRVGDSVRQRIAHIDSLGRVTGKLAKWQVNSSVLAMAMKKDTLYLTGAFSNIGENVTSGSVVILDTNGRSLPGMPLIKGKINSMIPDGNGGWYIGGQFGKADTTACNGLVHILSNGKVDSWLPVPNDYINAMVIHGGRLYIGGEFTSVNGQARNRLAAFDLSTGTLLGWNPNAGSTVSTLAAYGNKVFAGGYFTTISNLPRNYLAAIDTATGAPDAWSPNPNYYVSVLKTVNGLLYIGGTFNAIAGKNYGRLVRYDPANDSISPVTTSGIYGSVYDIFIKGNTIYIGGDFNSVNGQPRNDLAAVSLSTGALLSWDPLPASNLAGYVKALTCIDNTIYFGGLNSINGHYNTLWAADATTGALTSWSPHANSDVNVLLNDNGKLIAGGNFDAVGGVFRKVAAINVNTDQLLSFNPDVSVYATTYYPYIYAMALNGDTLYLGGNIATIGNSSRNYLGAVNATTGDLCNSFYPNLDGIIYTLLVYGNKLYAGGTFQRTGLGLQNNRMRLAAFDLVNGNAFPWDPNITSTGAAATCLAAKGGTIYIGGAFQTMNGISRNGFAAVDTATGALAPLNLPIYGSVNALCFRDSFIYLGGDFFEQLGKYSGLARININSGILDTTWFPAPVYNFNGGVKTLINTKYGVYAGGDYSMIGGYARNYAASIDLRNYTVTSWNPDASAQVRSISVNNNLLYMAGDFLKIGSLSRLRMAAVNRISGALSPWAPFANAQVNVIKAAGNTIYAGGAFTNAAGGNINYLVAIDSVTGVKKTWNPNPNGIVNTIALTGRNQVFVGGGFTSIGGQSRTGLAAVQVSNGTATSWNPQSNGAVNTILLAGRRLYAAGSFSAIGGQSRSYLAALDTTSGLATSWDPSPDNIVQTIAFNGTHIIAGGGFTSMGSSSRPYLAAVDTGTAAALSLNLNTNGPVLAYATRDSLLFAGGSFTSVDGTIRSYLAVIDTNLVFRCPVSAASHCPGSPASVPVFINRTFNTNNVFTVELSDSTGSFSSAVIIGSMASSISGSIPVHFPPGLPPGSGYRIRVRSSSPQMISENNNVYITILSKPVAAFTVNNSSQCLTGNAFSFTQSGTSGSLQSKWSFGDSDTSGQANPAKSYVMAGHYSVTLLVTNAAGCSDSASLTVRVNGMPDVSLNKTGNQAFCDGTRLKLSASGNDMLTFKWLNGTAIIPGEHDSVLYATTGGTYRVIAINNDNCSDTSLACDALLNPKPNGQINLVGNDSICAGTKTVLAGHQDTSYTYNWLKGVNTIQSGKTASIEVSDSGAYRLITGNSYGCTDTSQVIYIRVMPKPGVKIISGKNPAFCDSTELYVVPHSTGSVYNWAVTNGTIPGPGDTNTIKVKWNSTPGSGTIYMTEENRYGCVGDTMRLTVTLMLPPDSLSLNGVDSVWLPYSASATKIKIFSNRSWTVNNPASWLSVSPLSHTGTDSVVLSATANPDPFIRSVTVTFTAGTNIQTLVVQQDSNQSVGLKDPDAIPGISLFPNPSNGAFYIENSGQSMLHISLFDAYGKQLWNGEADPYAVKRIDCSLADGLYWVRLSDNKGRNMVKRMVIVQAR